MGFKSRNNFSPVEEAILELVTEQAVPVADLVGELRQESGLAATNSSVRAGLSNLVASGNVIQQGSRSTARFTTQPE